MSHHPPAVSVVLPVYNGRSFLRESIQSVLAQSFRDFEFLIWDDASNDGSWEIIESFSDPRIRRKRQASNRGLFPNLNDAIGEARGELIRIWCQDDRMKPACLEREQGFWKRHPQIGMFYCNRDTIDDSGAVIRPAPEDGTPEVMSGRLADEISSNWGSMPGNLANVTIPRRVLGTIGLFNDMKLAADFEMWIRIQAGHPIGFCREPLIELRSHRGQLSRSAGALLIFMRENHVIFETLEKRLPPAGAQARRRYARIARHVQYFHGGMRALLLGQWGYARQIFAQIARWESLPAVAFWWLATGNLRWARPKPIYTVSS